MHLLQEIDLPVVSVCQSSESAGQTVRKGRWMQDGEDEGQAGPHKLELERQWDPSLVLLPLTLVIRESCIC